MSEASSNGMGSQQSVDGQSNAIGLFVGAFVDELVRAGVSDVCLCPGSRSTPLAMTLRAHPGIRLWTHLDERSAAYFALGIAKVKRTPVAVVSTSGTAAVNFAPAVAEAAFGRVPLIVMTADRPPELRGVGALQTIDQVRLYGTHVKWFVEATLPEATEEALRYARTLAARAVATAGAPAYGPVHLNFPFREPLIPLAPPSITTEMDRPTVAVAQGTVQPALAVVAELARSLSSEPQGIIVCGPQDDPGFPAAVVNLGAALGYPVLADPLSQVRCGPHHHSLVLDSYEVFLRDPDVQAALAPRVVIRFGPMPVSKAAMVFLQRHSDARQIVVDQPDKWPDFIFTGDDVVHCDPRLFCTSLVAAMPGERAGSDGWLARWQEVAQVTRTALTAGLSAEVALSEPGTIAAIAEMLPEGATMVAGNSMPVRDVDIFFPGGPRSTPILGNRGASGIDGVVSTALGASTGASPLVLVIGDVSFYHDMNGLLAADRHGLSATIVLLNNDGGGIFSFLPQVEYPEHFEELFGTPHGLDFRHAAAMYGLTYRRAEGVTELREALAKSVGAPGVTLIEVPTERDANLRLHRRVISGALAAARRALARRVP